MALTDFFRINLPYGIVKSKDGKWYAFNREYVPIGWNDTKNQEQFNDDNSHLDIPIRTKYKNAKAALLKKLIDDDTTVRYDEAGKIKMIFLYKDKTNPANDKKYWDRYFEKIKILSSLKTVD